MIASSAPSPTSTLTSSRILLPRLLAYLISFAVLICSSTITRAQTSILQPDPTIGFDYYNSVLGGSAQRITVTGQTFTHAVRVTTAGTGANFYSAQLAW